MEHTSEKQFNTKSTFDTFDEIYTSYDLSVDADYSAGSGYPFDYPIRWLNDRSMNKRIAVRRLDATPSSHSFKLGIIAEVNEKITSVNEGENTEIDYTNHVDSMYVDITYKETLIKVMNMLTNEFYYDDHRLYLRDDQYIGEGGGLKYSYSATTNQLELTFTNSRDEQCPFRFQDDIDEFLRFLNQPLTDANRDILRNDSTKKHLMKYGRAIDYISTHHSQHPADTL